ncbi:alpha/beta hydrolase [Microbacterium sp. H37-C3]|uniref:alpha/beta fold hydrolase n=1 Tax=Microbacterium sp. H37-C3 TaxID=3004354 RepID=UPI0022AEC635|nr:alpha/beta hydrolase [Microbacterium sp. H37-C3]MCZ4067765.1 alpha/beta hydrolase [Microbacterium sp. H37-C3]
MTQHRRTIIDRDGVSLTVTEAGGSGSAVLLLHGLAGSSRELMPTADALTDRHRVLLLDQRGHGCSTRRPDDLSRDVFVADAVAVIERFAPDERVALVGQSMGAHTAFLTASRHSDLVSRLVMLEGHPAGSADPQDAADLGAFFASWPTPFADADAARAFLGDSPLVDAWVADLEKTPSGLRPRFDADVMQDVITAVHEPRWPEWEDLAVPTTAVFARHGMFSAEQQTELAARRPGTRILTLPEGSHDAHLDAFPPWVAALREALA